MSVVDGYYVGHGAGAPGVPDFTTAFPWSGPYPPVRPSNPLPGTFPGSVTVDMAAIQNVVFELQRRVAALEAAARGEHFPAVTVWTALGGGAVESIAISKE